MSELDLRTKADFLKALDRENKRSAKKILEQSDRADAAEAKIKELEANLQGRTVSCVCGALEKLEIANEMIDSLETRLALLKDVDKELDEARKECEEQARLLGMSASREAKLLAKIDALKAENERLHLDPGERAMYNEALAAEHNEVEKFKEIERKRADQVSQLVTDIYSLSYVVVELRKALEEAQRIECEASCKFLSGLGPLEHSKHCVLYSSAISLSIQANRGKEPTP